MPCDNEGLRRIGAIDEDDARIRGRNWGAKILQWLGRSGCLPMTKARIKQWLKCCQISIANHEDSRIIRAQPLRICALQITGRERLDHISITKTATRAPIRVRCAIKRLGNSAPRRLAGAFIRRINRRKSFAFETLNLSRCKGWMKRNIGQQIK